MAATTYLEHLTLFSMSTSTENAVRCFTVMVTMSPGSSEELMRNGTVFTSLFP